MAAIQHSPFTRYMHLQAQQQQAQEESSECLIIMDEMQQISVSDCNSPDTSPLDPEAPGVGVGVEASSFSSLDQNQSHQPQPHSLDSQPQGDNISYCLQLDDSDQSGLAMLGTMQMQMQLQSHQDSAQFYLQADDAAGGAAACCWTNPAETWHSDPFNPPAIKHEDQLVDSMKQQQQHHHHEEAMMEIDPAFYDAPFISSPAAAAAPAYTMHQMPLSCSSSNNPAAATTRAARKSRMARKRRSMVNPGVASSAAGSPTYSLNWGSPSPSTATPSPSLEDDKLQHKNLKFLLQKQLKPSDVGNLGRIVLPKKEAESRLPYLTVREGMILVMEDMTNARKWNLRYRFWPNNKSRMYLLENTGEFIKSHKLCEGDYLLLYKDCTNGNYVIYGKKTGSEDTNDGSEKQEAPKHHHHQQQQQHSSDLKVKRAKSLDFERSKWINSATNINTSKEDDISRACLTKACSDTDLAAVVAASTNKNKQICTAEIRNDHEEEDFALDGSSNFNVEELEQFPLLDSSELAIDEILELVDLPACDKST